MKKLPLAILILMLVCACAPPQPKGERYAREIEGSFDLSAHADYYRNTYLQSQRDEYFYGYISIREADILNKMYNTVLSEIETNSNVVINMKIFENALLSNLQTYSRTWAAAIENNVNNKHTTVDFDTALAIKQKEFFRTGVFEKMQIIANVLKNDIKKLDKEKYEKSYETYGIISQLVFLVEKPKGSLQSFNLTVNELVNNFNNAVSLAELEH